MMIDITILTLILVFTTPLLMALLTVVSKNGYHKWICLSGIGLVIVGLLLLGFWGIGDLDTTLSFMGEPITLSISNTAIYLYVGTLVILGWMVWFHADDHQPAMTTYHWVLLNLSLSFALIAFISGQFMIRYIALDIVGLLAALTVLTTFSATWGLRQFIIIFQILRFGDLCLLASILLINHTAGTLDISQMIAAATEMPMDARTWVYLGFLLALWVKLGIWPLGIWLERARKAAPFVSFWISGVLVPALGFYLVYRIIPFFNSTVLFQNLTLYSMLIIGILVMALTFSRTIKYDRFTHLGGLMSGFLLAGTAFGGVQFLLFYLLGLIFHRGLFFFYQETNSDAVNVLLTWLPLTINTLLIALNWQVFPLIFSIGWLSLTILVLLWDMRMQRHWAIQTPMPDLHTDSSRLNDAYYGRVLVSAARWLNRTLEFGILTEGILRLSKAFHRFANWLYRNVEMGFEKLWHWIVRKLFKISEGTLNIEGRMEDFLLWVTRWLLAVSEGTLNKVEIETAQKTGHMMDEALYSLEAYEQNVLKKALRWDLAWIPFFLVVILIMLFVL